MRLWTKQLDEGIHAATSSLSNGIAFRHQKLAWGMDKLEEFHRNMPNPKRREQSWENITKGGRLPLLHRRCQAIRQIAERHGSRLGDN